MELITTIENVMNNNNEIRTQANIIIDKMLEEDFFNYLEKMCLVLAGENYSVSVRQMSATLIKNPIVRSKKDDWINMETVKKEQIKSMILSTLGSEKEAVRKSVGAVISSIAKIETPISSKWSNLLSVLCQESFPDPKFHFAAVQALGFICEEMNRKNILPDEVDVILSAIIKGIQKNITNQEFIITSLKALIRVFPLIGTQKMYNSVIF